LLLQYQVLLLLLNQLPLQVDTLLHFLGGQLSQLHMGFSGTFPLFLLQLLELSLPSLDGV